MRHKRHQCIPSCSIIIDVDEEDLYRWKKGDDEIASTYSNPGRRAQLSRCITRTVAGSRTWIVGVMSRGKRNQNGPIDYNLTPVQDQRFQRLKDRATNVPFDETRPDHQEALRSLWNAAFPDEHLKGLVSAQWKEMGWQGVNPATDFRGCGFVGLENLLFLARTYPGCFRKLLFKHGEKRATWEYPFAVAGINLTYMLIQILELSSEKPRYRPGVNFVKLLGENEEAFDVLYCVAFALLDSQWLTMGASYMDFSTELMEFSSYELKQKVLQATKVQLERELSLEDVKSIRDLPAYNMLFE